MASKTEICNMALKHLAQKTVDNVDTENSAEAISCRTFYDIAVESLLRFAEWPFATTEADLGLIEEDPNEQWQFSYQYPAECLRFIEMVNPAEVTVIDPQTGRYAYLNSIPFEIRYGTSGREIWTNLEDAVGKYVRTISETGRFPPDFTLALSFHIASLIAPSVVGAEAYDVVEIAKAMANQWKNIAMAYHYNEEAVSQPQGPGLYRARM
jgi:hypothetical protein